MAEAILRKVATETGLGAEVKSAGISALHGGNASHHAFHVLKEKGIVPHHSSQRVSADLIHWADVILTMTSHHKYIVLHQFPESVEKTFSLKEYVHTHPEIERLQHALDQIYVEKETKRLEMKSRFAIDQEQDWSDESKKAYNMEMKALQEKEEQLITELQNILSHHDIHDPFGGSVEEYRACAEEIEQAVHQLIERWKKENR
jgi:protein-tyrosine phosphatase